MTLATIDAYSISVFLHVSAVVVGFGVDVRRGAACSPWR